MAVQGGRSTAVSIACGDFNRFPADMRTASMGRVVDSLKGDLQQRPRRLHRLLRGARRHRTCAQLRAVPRGPVEPHDRENVGRGVRPASSLSAAEPGGPWASNHPWLAAQIQVDSAEGRPAPPRGGHLERPSARASRKAHSPDRNPEWTPERAHVQLVDIIGELARRLVGSAPWDVVCLQEASPGQVEMQGPGDPHPQLYDVGPNAFTAGALTENIRRALGAQTGGTASHFEVVPASVFQWKAVPRAQSSGTWVLVREDHGRVILVRASAIDKRRYVTTDLKPRDAEWTAYHRREAHSAHLPLLWPSVGRGTPLALDTHISNFHPLPPGIKSTSLLRALGLRKPADVVRLPESAGPRLSVGAPVFVPSSQTRVSARRTPSSRTSRFAARHWADGSFRRRTRKRWGLRSRSPSWATSSSRKPRPKTRSSTRSGPKARSKSKR